MPKVSAIEVVANTTPLTQAAVFPADMLQAAPTIQAYPNTFRNYIDVRIEAKEPAEYQIKVYDVLGRPVYQSLFSTQSSANQVHKIDLTHKTLQKGMYLIYVENKNQKLLKIIKVIKD